MTKQILFIAAIFFRLISLGQSSDTLTVQNKNLFRYPAVVFKDKYDPNIMMSELKERFTPDTSDILSAEKIFLSQYSLIRPQENLNNETEVKQRFCKFVRQYVGYLDKNGEKNLIIHLIDSRKPSRTKTILGKGWQANFVIYFSEHRRLEIITYRINLVQQKIYETL